MRCHSRSRLFADARCRSLKGACSAGEHAHLRAGRAIVAVHIQVSTTGTALRGEREGQAESAEEHDSVLRVRLGRAVSVQLAASPAYDSSSARDVGSMSLKSVSSARLSRVFDAVCCQPGLPPGAGRVVRGAAAAASSSRSLAHGGAEKPSERRKRGACSAARVLASAAARKQAAAAAGPAASSARHLAAASRRRARSTGSASAQAAQ